ncbi:hypothetical protein JQS43_03500 [Natronosporangium hydrolyticum]|uniref:Uncharacterized protein n=1 Tax=Natronosporangium hydrolyticum TaxID=2811111 RepID=A0A895YL89_9ACTN|nr:hypothetical protein [Natronosporangium hydrolyticum]QSB15436.1 hypothetical protein JQS43_03500 [Natronosporangium hydrolyticum]
MSFLSVLPGVVGAAGSRTAMTAGDWSGWAQHSETMLRNAGGGCRSGKLSSAFDSYLAQLRPCLQNQAVRASALGGNAASAASAVDQADGDSSGVLGGQVGNLVSQASVLARQINFG